MYLIDVLHQAGIGVILDWVPSHFPHDAHGLAYFDGTHLFEHETESQRIHPDWKSHIFNYDLPQDPEDYVHRIGRTARAGQEGDAISFGCETYVMSLPDIEAYIGRKIPVASVNSEEPMPST